MLGLLACGLWLAGPSSGRADQPKPDYGSVRKPGILKSVGFDQKPGVTIPLDLEFRDEADRPVRLGDLLDGRPVILNLVYYNCPLLCNQVLDGLVRSLNVVDPKVGQDFNVISVSINPDEEPATAKVKEAMVLQRYTAGGARARDGWHFLTGDQAAITTLAGAVGFRYSYNEGTRQYAHPAGIMFLSPAGTIVRYVYGLSYPARDLRLALVDASNGKVGTFADQALLLCYVYDPASGSYSFAIMNVIRALGVVTVAALVGSIFVMVRRDRRRRAAAAGPATSYAPEPPPLAT